MLTEMKKEMRSDLFRHLDGLVTAPVAYLLLKKGLLEVLLSKNQANIYDLAAQFKANEGYLNIALRVLASQGWLTYTVAQDKIVVQTNERSAAAFNMFEAYGPVVELLHFSGKFHNRKFEKEPFSKLKEAYAAIRVFSKKLEGKKDLEKEIGHQILKHLEGHIVGPTAVALGMSGMFHKYFMEASFQAGEFHSDAESFGELLNIFTELGWFVRHQDNFKFTEKGLFFAKRASAYGVTVSYLPMFRQLEDLLFGDPKVLWKVEPGQPEIHVDREMNVWGSGGAHSSYFRDIDEVIINVFNRPIHEQPKGIVDMGCGNGAFLKHIYEVVEQRTVRGRMLEDHPLFLVGADFNDAALKVTRANLIQADIWAKVIWGDIGRPDLLASDLETNYGIALGDLLNVRTFLDHNRIWEDVEVTDANRISTSTGAFAFRGRRLPNELVEENLKHHFLKWAPYLQKFGLLLIELHTIDPALTAQNLGKTAATAYDATHGFSDQYIVEIDVLINIIRECGLDSIPEAFRRYPDNDTATISIHLIKGS